MAEENLVELKFRLADGTDIGPTNCSPSTSVGSLKERIVAQWPKGYNFFNFHYVLNYEFGCVSECLILLSYVFVESNYSCVLFFFVVLFSLVFGFASLWCSRT